MGKSHTKGVDVRKFSPFRKNALGFCSIFRKYIRRGCIYYVFCTEYIFIKIRILTKLNTCGVNKHGNVIGILLIRL